MGAAHPRLVADIFSPEDLERLRFIRENGKPLALEPINNAIVDRAYALELSDTFLPAAFLELFGEPTANPMRFPASTLEEELAGIESGFSPVCEGPRTSPEQWAVLGLGSVTTGTFKPEENKLLPPEISPRPEIEVKHGDVLVTRKNTYDLVAASVFVRRPRRDFCCLTPFFDLC